MRALTVGATVATVAAAFWIGALVGLDLDGDAAVRDAMKRAAWISGGLVAVLLAGIPYVQVSAARSAARIRADGPSTSEGMTSAERAFVQAFWRQLETTSAILNGPDRRAFAERDLPGLVLETHHAMRAAGLVDADENRIETLVRQLHPEFRMSGGGMASKPAGGPA
ncbi:hypothetical protein [Streptomyces chryseus]|uniref:hypothetical protein n=1 Tax=Streptomyces chryseus TaxID=68186 RepID=UPI00110FE345|nr:hypothetical protein [Streptomyces chryseus]